MVGVGDRSDTRRNTHCTEMLAILTIIPMQLYALRPSTAYTPLPPRCHPHDKPLQPTQTTCRSTHHSGGVLRVSQHTAQTSSLVLVGERHVLGEYEEAGGGGREGIEIHREGVQAGSDGNQSRMTHRPLKKQRRVQPSR